MQCAQSTTSVCAAEHYDIQPCRLPWELQHHVLSLHVWWQAAGEVVAAHFTEGSPAAATLGVFVGIQQMEYGNLAAPFLAKMGPFTATGGPFSVAAGRVSFTFGFKGPAVRLLLRSCSSWLPALQLWHSSAAAQIAGSPAAE